MTTIQIKRVPDDVHATLSRRAIMSHELLVERSWMVRGNVTPYDAQYVAPAELVGIVLVTVDDRLSRVPGTACGIELLSQNSNN